MKNGPNRSKACAAVSVAREPYTWHGGYPRYLVMADGGCLCPKCTRAELRQIVFYTRHPQHSGWEAAGADVNWEDGALACDHCGQLIEAAYRDE